MATRITIGDIKASWNGTDGQYIFELPMTFTDIDVPNISFSKVENVQIMNGFSAEMLPAKKAEWMAKIEGELRHFQNIFVILKAIGFAKNDYMETSDYTLKKPIV